MKIIVFIVVIGESLKFSLYLYLIDGSFGYFRMFVFDGFIYSFLIMLKVVYEVE